MWDQKWNFIYETELKPKFPFDFHDVEQDHEHLMKYD